MTKKHHHHEHSQPAAGAPEQELPPNLPAGEPANIEVLQKQLEEVHAELEDTKDKMLRFKAEAENTRRRGALDVENAQKFGMEKLARELLNVVDSLEHGLQAVSEPDQTQIVHLREGMQLTHKLLMDTLEKFQIKQINPQGATFDPKQHEALTAQPTNEVEPNKVLNVVQKGFTIHDRILRPARVIVAKAPEDIANKT
ncbi:MAG TPA: nucleotide exchange factor GrpE [Gammaproteobacteria bacterium]|nr:nucleotide exchange factor GrpE [Gammaproteobacteria bacterium]